MLKKFLSLILVFLLTFTLAACGGEGGSEDTDSVKTWYMGGKNLMSGDKDPKELFEGVADTVNPASIYSSTEITAEMLHGAYTLNNKKDDIKAVRESTPFEDVKFKNGAFNISAVPIAAYLGSEYFCNGQTLYKYSEFKGVTDREIAVLEFATKDDIGMVVCTYEVDKNTVTFKQIEQTSAAEAPFKYDFTGIEFKYNFTVSGPYLTLTKGETSIKLTAFCVSANTDEELYLTGYSLPDTALVDELDYFVSSDIFNYAVKRDGSFYDRSAFKITDDGKFTIYLYEDNFVDPPKTFIKQYVYIMQSSADTYLTDFKILLLDGEKQYYYTDDITMREARVLKESGIDTENLTAEQIESIAEKKSDLFKDLKEAFETQGINVTVNHSSGEISMDASVLFGGDSAEVTADGKTLLNKFLKAYTSIIYNDKYNGFISKTMVEGHTAPVAGSTYESGLALSKERADNVKAYCLSSDTGVDVSKLSSSFEAVGLSNSKPVYGADGEVNMEACRRVSFRFIVDISSIK